MYLLPFVILFILKLFFLQNAARNQEGNSKGDNPKDAADRIDISAHQGFIYPLDHG